MIAVLSQLPYISHTFCRRFADRRISAQITGL